MTLVRQAFVTYGLLVASTVLAQAADPIKLRVADSFPKGHYLVKLVLEPWMEQVQKRTNGAVTFEHYPAQQLGKAADMLKLTQTGVADIGYVAPAYTSDKMPVSEVAMLPGAFAHSCQGTLAYWKLARSGVIAEQDYAGNNIRLLLAVSLPQYRIFTVKQPVKNVADVTGLKLRSTGGAQDLTLRAIGAVPVRMAAPDAYKIAVARHHGRPVVSAGERGRLWRRQAGEARDRRTRLRQLHRFLFHQRSFVEKAFAGDPEGDDRCR